VSSPPIHTLQLAVYAANEKQPCSSKETRLERNGKTALFLAERAFRDGVNVYAKNRPEPVVSARLLIFIRERKSSELRIFLSSA
jgi:hypothetical protein